VAAGIDVFSPMLQLAKSVKPVKKELQEQPPEKARKKSRHNAREGDGWWVPQEIVSFLKNMPRNAEGISSDAITWVYE